MCHSRKEENSGDSFSSNRGPLQLRKDSPLASVTSHAHGLVYREYRGEIPSEMECEEASQAPCCEPMI